MEDLFDSFFFVMEDKTCIEISNLFYFKYKESLKFLIMIKQKIIFTNIA